MDPFYRWESWSSERWSRLPKIMCLWQSWDPRRHLFKVRSRVLSHYPMLFHLAFSYTGCEGLELSIPSRKMVEQVHSSLGFLLQWEGDWFKFYPLLDTRRKSLFFSQWESILNWELGGREEAKADLSLSLPALKAQDKLSALKVTVNSSLWLAQTHIACSRSSNNILLKQVG